LACLCCLTGYLNEEVIIPKIAVYLDDAKLARSKNPLKRLKKRPFTILHLKDSSKLIYQSYDQKTHSFFDVYWIRSFDDIWHMKNFSADPKNPKHALVKFIISIRKIPCYICSFKNIKRPTIIIINNKIMANLNQVKTLLEKNRIEYTDKVLEDDSNFARVTLNYAEAIGADLIMIMTQQEDKSFREYLIETYAQQIVNDAGNVPIFCINPTYEGFRTEFIK